MSQDLCALCRKSPAEMTYAVDPEHPKPLCSACFGRWSPRTLDGLLGVRQADYGPELAVLILVPAVLFALSAALKVMA